MTFPKAISQLRLQSPKPRSLISKSQSRSREILNGSSLSSPNLLEDNRIFPGAEIYKKHNSKVKLEPIFSMPKARRKSPFE